MLNETQAYPSATAPGPGTMLADRYELGRILGRGGMADVLEAADTSLGRDVAIKLFRPEAAAAAEQTRSTGEIRVLAALRHPGLVTLYDAGTANAETVDARPFLVMELVTGPTLAHQLAGGPLPPAVVADLGAQLADTLAYVHANGIVHRDVKPANILLDETPGHRGTWTAKLTDFGVARVIDTTRLTQAGMTVGTANYLSPEQATGRDVGPASDVYTLGLVLLEALTGRVAFPGNGVAAASARLHRDPEVPEHLETRWRDLLAAMTRRDPVERPSAAAAAATLRDIAQQSPDPVALPAAAPAGIGTAPTRQLPALAPTVTPPPPSSHRRRPSRSVVLLLAAAIACAIAVIIVVLTSSGGAPVPERTPAPAPSYPAVTGTVGSLLNHLETLVAG